MKHISQVGTFGGKAIADIAAMTPRQHVEWARQLAETFGMADPDAPLCDVCGGDGWTNGGDEWCPACKGTGRKRPERCSVCGGHAWVRGEEGRNVVAVPCTACSGGVERTMDRLAAAGVPEFYRRFTFESFWDLTDASEAQLEACRLAIALSEDPDGFQKQHGRRGLCLLGPAGVRKTGIAVPVLSRLGPYMYTMRFVSWRPLLDQIARSWRSDSTVSEEQVIEEAARSQLVLIDDFGGAVGGRSPDWVADRAWKLIEARIHRTDGVTLITSNRTLAELEEQYGEPVVSRIRQLCVVVEVTGEDERRRAA